MLMSVPGLMDEIRARFAHVDICPFEGPRVFFENAGGALTLKSVAETSADYAGYPDNQGRDNPASRALVAAIARGKADMRTFFNAPSGQVFVGESGSEVLFRLVRTSALGGKSSGIMLGSTLEHPASRSAMTRWAEVTGRPHVLVPHDDVTGTVDVAAYRKHITPEVRVATIIQTSPVTGISVDVQPSPPPFAKSRRNVSSSSTASSMPAMAISISQLTVSMVMPSRLTRFSPATVTAWAGPRTA